MIALKGDYIIYIPLTDSNHDYETRVRTNLNIG